MNTATKIVGSIIIIALLLGWFLFRPITDELLLVDSRIKTTKTFDVPMVYIVNCSQCSLSPKAQSIGAFLMPQTSLYNTTGFLDEDSVIKQVNVDEEFTVEQVFISHPHGLEAAFKNESIFLVVKDTQGFVSVVSEYVDEMIAFDIKSNTRETHINSQLISDNQEPRRKRTGYDRTAWSYSNLS